MFSKIPKSSVQLPGYQRHQQQDPAGERQGQIDGQLVHGSTYIHYQSIYIYNIYGHIPFIIIHPVFGFEY